MSRPTPPVLVALLVVVLAAVGVALVTLRPTPQQTAAVAPSSSPSPSVLPSPSPTPAPTSSPSPSPPPALPPAPEPLPEPTPEPTPEVDVVAVQQQLTDLRYYVGAIDGKAGPATRSAVMAFQKVKGLVADGIVGPLTLAALADPQTPQLRGGEPDRVEVDLSTQVLYVVSDDQLERILPVSSGSGERYTTASGSAARSLTPVGDYRVERRISGLREAPLGSLYDPLYFHRGWAIHGSSSVPAYPASHGCVRVTRADARWLFDRVPNGTQVSLYGGEHTFVAGSRAAGTDTPAA